MILIFGGTTEGRIAIDVCEQAGKPYYYSTKGSRQEVSLHHGIRLTGAMDLAALRQFCHEKDIRCLVNAAHPFATQLHDTLAQLSLPVIRLQRAFDPPLAGVTYCADFDEAVASLMAQPPKRLLALSGTNTIAKLKPYWQKHPTLFRILDREESQAEAARQGFPLEQLLYFPDHLPGVDEERKLMQQVGCDAILTKESGSSGGYLAKVEAARQLGLRIWVVQHPSLPTHWHYVTGPHGLRRALQQYCPDFFPLRTGLTTGACATAAVKAALLTHLGEDAVEEVAFALPNEEVIRIPVWEAHDGQATVVKEDNDDPDVTKGCRITARIVPGTHGIRFLQGEGVGRVTLPGLGIEVGEPAINPTPRAMITREIRCLSDADYDVTLSVEGGEELAQRTFNHKVGVVGGISIIGTSGIVSPLSNDAFVRSIRRELEVARAIGCHEIGLVAGMKSERNLRAQHDVRCVHYGNFIGEALQAAHELGFTHVHLAIMIGKAIKLAEGHLDTHSHKVQMNRAFVIDLATQLQIAPPPEGWDNAFVMARDLWRVMPPRFFEAVTQRCYQHTRRVFPTGQLTIHLVCEQDSRSSSLR